MQEAQTKETTPMRQNAQGHWVPETLITPADKLRDEVVMAIIAAAREQRSLLAAFKIDAMQQIADFVDLSAEQYGVAWLPSDFKKQERYKRSIALSREYGLYRQNFCGCVYSKQEKEKPV